MDTVRGLAYPGSDMIFCWHNKMLRKSKIWQTLDWDILKSKDLVWQLLHKIWRRKCPPQKASAGCHCCIFHNGSILHINAASFYNDILNYQKITIPVLTLWGLRGGPDVYFLCILMHNEEYHKHTQKKRHSLLKIPLCSQWERIYRWQRPLLENQSGLHWNTENYPLLNMPYRIIPLTSTSKLHMLLYFHSPKIWKKKQNERRRQKNP